MPSHETLVVLVRLARLAAAVPQPGRPLPSLPLRTLDVTHQQPDDAYSPDAIRWWLRGRCPRCHWAMLESAVEGGTGCSGMGSGKGDRYGLINLKADLEHAADLLPLHWQTTAWVFNRQHRISALIQRRRLHPAPIEAPSVPQESPVPSVALETAIWRMATSLGYQEDVGRVA